MFTPRGASALPRSLYVAVPLLLTVLGSPTAAVAALIQPDTADASSEFNSNYIAENTINGSGLPSGFTPADAHAAYTTGNHWTTDGTEPTAESITWGFSAPQTIDAIHVWNHQSSPGHAANPGYDVITFDLTLFDASAGVLLSLDNVALAPDTATGQTFSLGGVGGIAGVSSVVFEIEATQSSQTFTGLAEVAFNTAVRSVPEPGTLAVFGFGLAALSVARRRRAS